MKIQDQKLTHLIAKYQDHLESWEFLRGIDYNVAAMHKELAKSYEEKIAQYFKDKQ